MTASHSHGGLGSPRRRTRIAYLAHGIWGRQGGVHGKIVAQASAWTDLDPDVDVGIFVRCDAFVERDWVGAPHVVSVRSSRAGLIGRLLARELLSIDLARWRPDLIYLRQSTVSPSLVVLAAAFPTVIEMNTMDLRELRLSSKPRYWYARITRDRLLRLARGLVVVSDEIASDDTVRRLRRPVAVIPNSIDLARHDSLGAPANLAPHLVFLGSPRSGLEVHWAGFDKISRMAMEFPDWVFDIIGPTRDQVRNAPPNITVHGPMDRTAYLPILSRADVAISHLALYRKEMARTSTLKVAEYLAYGLPVIIGYTETAFPSGAPFLLEIPNTEDNVERSLDAIHDFVLGWMGRRVSHEDIGAIDRKQVERRRLDFILQASAISRTRRVVGVRS